LIYIFDKPLHCTILDWLKKYYDLNTAAAVQAGFTKDLFYQLMVLGAEAAMGY